jgi:hypothetical protein
MPPDYHRIYQWGYPRLAGESSVYPRQWPGVRRPVTTLGTDAGHSEYSHRATSVRPCQRLPSGQMRGTRSTHTGPLPSGQTRGCSVSQCGWTQLRS